ncbi:MAG: ABC transporter permease [Cyclobacteriaceae bacterium]
MLKSYFLVAIRHLKRQPGYASLNILGLTIGIVSALMIALYLNQELSFDNYQENADRLYRVSSRISEPDNSFNWAVTQMPLGRTVKNEFTEVEQYVRFVRSGQVRFRKQDDESSYFVDDTYLVDSTIFDVFTYDFIMGDPENALNEPNSIVLSKSNADKIFKGENPMGQMLRSEQNSYKVTGVYADQPSNSHLIAGSLASLSTLDRLYSSQNWGGFSIFTYLLLNSPADKQVVEDRLNKEIIDTHVAVIFDQFDIEIVYEMINVRDIHLYSDFEGEPVPPGSIEYIYIFSAVGLFLVLIACINYMNLATARSVRRSLEVGLRKVMGAQRSSLIGQFITESIIITLVALFCGVLLLVLLVPFINNLVGTSLDTSQLLEPELISIVLGLLLVTGVLSGSYPAFYLSAFKPIQALRGGKSGQSGNIWLRRVLVGLQFAISIFMLVSTFVIYDQMQFVREADLGFDKDQVVTFSMNQQTRDKWQILKRELLQHPSISAAATATTTPGNGYGKNVMSVETKEGTMEDYGVDSYGVDYEYFNTLGIEVVQGRNFSTEFVMDTANAVMINEAMVRRLGWTDPIGKRFQFDRDSTVFHKVVGVVKDFHQQSLYDPISALMFQPGFDYSQALVKIGGSIPEAINHIESSWNELFPNIPLEYQFLDQQFMEEYESDQLRGKMFLGFSLMMIVISCLGLLGLASFIAEQRTKEISIRKVLGAEVNALVVLLVKDFVWLVLIGAVPAFVAGYVLMNQWLDTFQYHVNLDAMLFLVVLFIILLMTTLTTGYHAYKAAITNPSDNLKYE